MDDLHRSNGREKFISWTATALLAALILVLFEWDHYRRLLRLNTLPHSLCDRMVIGWLLLAKTLCLLVPLLLGAAALWRWRKQRAAQFLWFGGLVAMLLWLVVDLRVQQTTGRHLLSYAGFLLDPTTFRWAGDLIGVLPTVLFAALIVMACVAVLHAMCGWALRRLGARWQGLNNARGLTVCVSSLVVLILGVVPAHALVYCTVAVEQVHQSLPCNPLAFALYQANQDEHDRFRLAVQRELAPALAGLNAAPPADDQLIVVAEPRPHVVVIVLESLRHDALTSAYLPRMAARLKDGLAFDKHYAGTNCSHLGIFTLLYARAPLQYQETVGKVEPQACASFHRAGYECSFLTSGAVEYLRMNEFLCQPAFDRVEVCNHQDDWPNDDRVVLRRARQILASDRPQFLTMFLMSTHFPYRYPLEYERHRPVIPADKMLQATPGQREEALNRYRNAAAFLDDELADFVAQLDPQKHIVVLTGDHGESVFDDGTLTHWGRLSEAQMRTPLAIAGLNVPRQTITTATTHADLLPTLLHLLSASAVQLRHSSGRDMLLGPQPDQAWICTQYPSSRHWEGLLIRGPDRLGVKFLADAGWVQVTGMLDENGRFNPRRRPSIDEAPGWAATLLDEWSKLARR
jgi:membrane-anchored protein YejM (alkaline phosphatase superfamily)